MIFIFIFFLLSVRFCSTAIFDKLRALDSRVQLVIVKPFVRHGVRAKDGECVLLSRRSEIKKGKQNESFLKI